MAKKILVVDDEKLIVKGIRFSLEQDGYEVDCAYDGEEALQKAKENEYDMVLLDLMLPKLSGLEVCQQIRGLSQVPIIMLTAKSEDMDKIMGLEYGADDYITKPFNILEVKARIKAILRRSSRTETEKERPKTVEINGLKMDCESRRVYVNGKEINLRPDGGCPYPETAREDRGEPERSKVCPHEVGRRLLFSGIKNERGTCRALPMQGLTARMI